MVVGTSQAFGEDCPCTGRVLVFQPCKAQVEGSEAEEQWSANMLYARSVLAPVAHPETQEKKREKKNVLHLCTARAVN